MDRDQDARRLLVTASRASSPRRCSVAPPARRLSSLTTENFHYFDGVCYTQDGLTHRHQWEWSTLEPSFTFPANGPRPDYCYLDVVAASWEHTGLQVRRVSSAFLHLIVVAGPRTRRRSARSRLRRDRRRPRPRLQLRPVSASVLARAICPRRRHPRATPHSCHASQVNIFLQPTRKLRAALVSPDFYLAARGERTVHRIALGKGAAGRDNVRQLIEFIEAMQVALSFFWFDRTRVVVAPNLCRTGALRRARLGSRADVPSAAALVCRL